MKHGLYNDENGKKSRLYHIWEDMKNRCSNSNNKRYSNYGGRGISVSEKWNNYLEFHNWAIKNGYCNNLTIDRINVNGNYDPTNCRWSTSKEQANNRTNNIYITFKNKTLTMQQWSEMLGFEKHVLRNRIKRNWSIERALTTPKIEKK
jgi:hypothetical protein